MAQDRPDDDPTAMFRPGASGADNSGGDPISLNKQQPEPTAYNPGGYGAYDPNNPYGQQNTYGQQPAYGQQPNPYGQSYDPNAQYGAAPPYDPNQYPQYGQQQAYGQPAYGGYPQQQGYGAGYPAPTNGMAIAAIICAFVFAPLGVIFGIISRNQIKQSGENGDGLALAGIIIGGVFTALFVLMIVFFIIAAAAATSAISSSVPGY